MVIRRVEVNGEKTEERAYHLGSVKTAEEYARGVRMHWGIESTHWSLDVTSREDASRTRKGCAPRNLGLQKESNSEYKCCNGILKKSFEKDFWKKVGSCFYRALRSKNH